jgi:hypothetical protein
LAARRALQAKMLSVPTVLTPIAWAGVVRQRVVREHRGGRDRRHLHRPETGEVGRVGGGRQRYVGAASVCATNSRHSSWLLPSMIGTWLKFPLVNAAPTELVRT